MRFSWPFAVIRTLQVEDYGLPDTGEIIFLFFMGCTGFPLTLLLRWLLNRGTDLLSLTFYNRNVNLVFYGDHFSTVILFIAASQFRKSTVSPLFAKPLAPRGRKKSYRLAWSWFSTLRAGHIHYSITDRPKMWVHWCKTLMKCGASVYVTPPSPTNYGFWLRHTRTKHKNIFAMHSQEPNCNDVTW